MNVNFTKPLSVLDKDPYFNNVSLLMHMNGISGSKNFVDSSANNIQSTAIGNIEVSSARTRFGNGAAFLFGNGTGNYIRVSGNPNLAVGTSDYTLEMWAYVNSDSPFVIFDAAPINSPGSRPDAFLFYIEGTRDPRFFGNGLSIVTPAGSFPINQWAHLALVRNTGTTTIYINGTGISSSTGFYNATIATGGCLIGGFADNLNFTSNGYIDELRLTKGVARYTGNFTPPTAEFPDNSSQPKSLRFLKSNDGKKTLLRPVNLPTIPSPVPTDGLLVRFNADSSVTESGGSISSWTDQQNGVIATAFNGPTLLTNQLNGRKAVSFDGSNDYFTFTLPQSLTSSRTFIIIGKYTNPAGRPQNGMLNSQNPADRAYIFHDAGTTNAYFYTSNGQIGPATITPNTYIIQTVIHRVNGTGRIRINGSNQGSTSLNIPETISDFIIGGRNPSNEMFLGAIVEILIYNRELTTQEIQQIEAYASVI